jgi:hypothetical protein
MAAFLASCGEEPMIGPDEFHRVGGYYTGSIEGTTSVGSFFGAIWMNLVQSDGTLNGSYDFTGDVYHAEQDRKYYQGGSGTVGGTLASGPSPGVSLTLVPDDCPDRVMTYQGSYDDESRRISISGSLLLSTDSCDPLFSIPYNTILTRD